MQDFLLTSSVIVALVITSCANALTLARVKEASLPKFEASKIEQIACIGTLKVKADIVTAYKYEDRELSQPFDYAYVQCKPHGEFKGSPTYSTSLCDFTNKKWICDEAELHISVTINNRKVDVVPGATKPELAEDILQKISTYGGFRGRSIDRGIGDHCSFHSTSDAEELELMCSDNIKISFWCPQPEITHCPRILDMNLIIND